MLIMIICVIFGIYIAHRKSKGKDFEYKVFDLALGAAIGIIAGIVFLQIIVVMLPYIKEQYESDDIKLILFLLFPVK